ncbi:MAG: DUF3168 domain-containing protein [Parcubacteria group bacterium]|jgi:hypothetical protein
MTTLAEGLYSKLSTTAGITTLASTRTYPMQLPYNPVLPAITYRDVTLRTEQQFASTALKITRWQIDAWAVSYDAATDLADAITTALDGFVGTMGVACDVTLAGRVDLIDPETKWFHIAVDFEIWTN